MYRWLRKWTPYILLAAVAILMLNIIATVVVEAPKVSNVASSAIPNVPGRISTPAQPALFEYIEVVDSCGPNHETACVVGRTGPGESYPSVERLRTGMVLRTSGTIESGGRTWYKIIFDEWLRYPDRIGKDLYVAADYVTPILDQGPQDLGGHAGATTSKRILIDRSEQILYAYAGDTLFVQLRISTGLEFTPTPRGTFTVYKKTPTRYMQGPLQGISDQYYDLPGVPWNLYFTEQGAVIHGAYWHDEFGKQWSHGCVNLPPEEAKKLYRWADLGTPVIVRD